MGYDTTGHRKAECEKGCQLYAAVPLAERGIRCGDIWTYASRPRDG